MKNLPCKIIVLFWLFLTNYPCNAQGEQNSDWSVNRYVKTVDNVTYNFPSSADINTRNTFIDQCRNAIKNSLDIIRETNFSDTIDVVFYESRQQLKKYTGIQGCGLASPDRRIMFIVISEPPIQHEMMHMVSMLNWGFPSELSKWINEGMATCSAGKCSGFTVEEIYCYFQRNNMLIPMEKLSSNFYSNPEMIAYHQSGYLVEYLKDKYGIESLKKLWVEGMDKFESIYKIPFSAVLNEIGNKLKTKYPETPKINWEEFKKGCN